MCGKGAKNELVQTLGPVRRGLVRLGYESKRRVSARDNPITTC